MERVKLFVLFLCTIVKIQCHNFSETTPILHLYGLDIQEKVFEESVNILNYNNKLHSCQSLILITNSYRSQEYITIGETPRNRMPLVLLSPSEKNSAGIGSSMFVTKFSKSCSLIIYYHLQYDAWSWIGGQRYFLEILPGGIFHSFHLIIANYNYRQTNIFQRPVPLVLTQMHNVLVAIERENWYDTEKILSYVTPNVWYNDSIHLSPGNYHQIYTKWFDYGSFGPLVIATTPDNLQIEMDEYRKTKIVKKFLLTCFSEMVNYINTSGTLLPVKSGIYGQKDKKTGKWEGLIAKIYSGEAHLTTIVAMGGDRSEIIRYGTIFAIDQVIFISGLPKELNLPGSLSFLISPFSFILWICVLLSFLALYVVLWVTKSIEDKMVSKSVALGLVNIILRSIVDQTGDTRNLTRKLLKSNLMRFVFILWLLGIIVLSSGYKSKFISSFVTPYVKHPPRTWSELSESNYDIGGVLFTQTIVGPSFRQLNNSIGRAVVSKIKEYSLFKPECYLAVEKGDQVCLGLQEFVKNVANLYLTDHRGKSLYKRSRDTLFLVAGGTTVSRKFPHLLEPLNLITGRFLSQGLYDYWLNKEKVVNKVKGRKISHTLRKPKDTKLERSHGLPLIIIISIGLSCSIVAFIAEFLLHRITNSASLKNAIFLQIR